jgi:putative ABC transport system permease protein
MKKNPPKRALQFLRWFCREDYLDEIEGDLTEVFKKQSENSPRNAKWKFTWSVMKYLRPEFIKSFETKYQPTLLAMVSHNILISYRHFMRYKGSFLINLIGLSTGLACVLLIYLWVADELSIDKFFQKDEQLYQVMVNYQFPDGIKTFQNTPSPLAEALAEEIPEIEYAVSVNAFTDWFSGAGVVSYENRPIKAKGIFASKDYFNVFSHKLIQGNKDEVLTDRNGIMISEGLAMRLFNTMEGIIGKTLEWNHKMHLDGPFHITGIFESPPDNATSQFDLVFNYKKLIEGDEYSNEWNSSYAETFVILKKGTDVDAFNDKISGYLSLKDPKNKTTLFVSRYSNMYLNDHYENGVQSGGRIEYVRLFSVIALTILTIACINFINLATAQASRKMKEVGIKKAMGINQNALIGQFLGESMLMTLLSLIVAIPIVVLLLPQFNEVTNKHLRFIAGPDAMLLILGIVLLTGFMSGCYPAFYLSRFNPIAVLKGKLATTFGELWVRKGLVVVQFTASIIFIVGFFIVNKQIEFTQSKNLGYHKDNVICFQRQGRLDQNDHEAFISALKNIRGVVNASCMFGSLLDRDGAMHSGFSWDGQATNETEMSFPSPAISHDFIETLGIEIKEGRTFSIDYANEESKVIVNEAAVKMMSLQNPVGKTIRYGSMEKQIIGVVKDFQYGSLHNKLEPVIFMYAPRRSDIVVRVAAESARMTIDGLKEVYEKFHPGYPFDFTFMDDDYKALYDSENKVAVLSKYFALLAIIISCLGLFGLIAFTAQRREKEIGIRKILGASEFGILNLLSGDFTKMAITAIFIALPLSYFIVATWLENFAYRIDLEWRFFIVVGMVALIIPWLTVSIHTLKAARVNPAQCLRNNS